jgi:hypothetical protein
MKYLIAASMMWLACATSAAPSGEPGGIGGSNGGRADIDGFPPRGGADDLGSAIGDVVDLGGGWGGGHPDLATPRQNSPDLATPPSGKTGCHGEVQCVNACASSDSACLTACQSNTTSSGDQLRPELAVGRRPVRKRPLYLQRRHALGLG